MKLQLSEKDEEITSHKKRISKLEEDLKSEDTMNENFKHENQQFKQQITNLKSDFEKRILDLEQRLQTEQNEARTKDELLGQA